MNKILKGATVLLISFVLIFSTIAVTADTNKDIKESCLKTTNQNPVINPVKPTIGPVIFSQEPYEPDENWIFYTSTNYSDPKFLCQDDFWGLEKPICDIHWWGLCLANPWGPCNPEGMLFEIIFYEDSGGIPGSPVCIYSDVSPSFTNTGMFYDDYEMYYWETELDPCCDISQGWVSIQNTYSPSRCWFLWTGSPTTPKNGLQNGEPIDPENSLAFKLTAEEEPCIPSIDVEKYVWDQENGKWIQADNPAQALDIEISTDVTFRIVVINDGECPLFEIKIHDWMHDSLEFVSTDPEAHIFEYNPPEYYMEWNFTEPLTPGGTIEIYVYGHVVGPDSSKDYNRVYVQGFAEEAGEFVEDEDEAWVHAIEKSRIIISPFLNWLKNHPNMFPMLQLLLQRIGL